MARVAALAVAVVLAALCASAAADGGECAICKYIGDALSAGYSAQQIGSNREFCAYGLNVPNPTQAQLNFCQNIVNFVANLLIQAHQTNPSWGPSEGCEYVVKVCRKPFYDYIPFEDVADLAGDLLGGRRRRDAASDAAAANSTTLGQLYCAQHPEETTFCTNGTVNVEWGTVFGPYFVNRARRMIAMGSRANMTLPDGKTGHCRADFNEGVWHCVEDRSLDAMSIGAGMPAAADSASSGSGSSGYSSGQMAGAIIGTLVACAAVAVAAVVISRRRSAAASLGRGSSEMTERMLQ